ncbi:bifunctional levopimaradiene synthase, chloroplastic-like [Canna indica]|uniref:Bifunctional levopimaradiene synthase, chloroplastic-like n=1 Tax=Canna indica TaxID=4628 RepID=A0AAQ3QD83_9LILI|nr:bifunctional levopimaradiene synthase, chloroplastic-like [Canna indica]
MANLNYSLSLLSTHCNIPKQYISSKKPPLGVQLQHFHRHHSRQFLGHPKSIRARRTPPAPVVFCSSTFLSQSQSPLAIQEEEKQMMEGLIGDIKHELACTGERMKAEDLMEKLQLVDLIQRLGIPRFFEPQIEEILNTTFKQWDEIHGLGGGGRTVLAFRLLRLHGFSISAGVIENLEDESGKFYSFSTESHEKITDMINLYKCSQTGFPSESKIMDKAQDFSVKQLRRVLSHGNPSLLQQNNIRSEIKFALEYPRRYLLWRLESRSIIRQLWPSTGIKNKCLQLAKQDLEILQKVHKEETNEITKWWVGLGIPDLEFARNSVLKSYFSVSVAIFEPQFAAFRAAFTKTACLTIVVDDLCDLPSNDFDSISRFVDAFKRWDASLLDDLPEHKVALTCVQRTVIEQATESSKAQGRDLFPFFKALWDDLLLVFAKETEWRCKGQIPTWNEYMEIAYTSIAGIIILWTSVFLMGEMITDEVLSQVGKDSRFMYLVSLVARLANDLASLERETRDGKLVSAVNCYMREKPNCSKEGAIAAVQNLIESACRELELELFKSRGTVPECCSRAILNFARTTSFIYKRDDAFSNECDDEYEDLVKDCMYGSFE